MASIKEKYPSLANMDMDNFIESGDGREERVLQFVINHPDVTQMRGSPTKVLNAIDEFAYQKEFMINIGSEKAKLVIDIIRKEKPKVFVELGGYVGYSAICFANAMKEANPDAAAAGKLQYWSLELDESYCRIAEQLTELAGLSDLVKFVSGSAAESLKQLKADGKVNNVDVLFLDHLEDLYIPDLQTSEDLGFLSSGSLVLADNVLTPGAPEYRAYVRSKARYESTAIKGRIMPGELMDEVEITRVL